MSSQASAATGKQIRVYAFLTDNVEDKIGGTDLSATALVTCHTGIAPDTPLHKQHLLKLQEEVNRLDGIQGYTKWSAEDKATLESLIGNFGRDVAEDWYRQEYTARMIAEAAKKPKTKGSRMNYTLVEISKDEGEQLREEADSAYKRQRESDRDSAEVGSETMAEESEHPKIQVFPFIKIGHLPNGTTLIEPSWIGNFVSGNGASAEMYESFRSYMAELRGCGRAYSKTSKEGSTGHSVFQKDLRSAYSAWNRTFDNKVRSFSKEKGFADGLSYMSREDGSRILAEKTQNLRKTSTGRPAQITYYTGSS